ncbi:hypothetical protein GQ44DRAFT_713295 [Phaeosphaeriaceae sp. PMI808]|nr:hypothetical protein GQ44DRAFT_713295 [Phaeosphaeriaceae sp. PMI808]
MTKQSKKKWIPTASCTFPPEAIPLGQVICDPTQPHRPLSFDSIPLITSNTQVSVKTSPKWNMNQTNTRTINTELSFSISSTIFPLAMLDILGEGRFTKEAGGKYEFAEMQEQWFEPMGDFAERVVADAEVREFFAKNDHKKPIFAVTGLMLGEEGVVERVKSTEFFGWLPGVSGKSHLRQSEGFGVKAPVVLAYKLCKISLKSPEANPETKEYVKGAQW